MTAAAQLPDWLRELYPFEPKSFVTPRGARMSYLDEGPRHDEAVLMLHGNPSWSFLYRNLVPLLSASVRCIVPDHIGMGLSDKPQDYDYRLTTRIDDIVALVRSLKLRRVHLVVHDWGGAIGFGFAARQTVEIGRSVVLNTAAFPSDLIPHRIALCRAPVIGEWLVRGLNGFAGPATWMTTYARSLTSREKAGYLYPYRSWDTRIAVHRFVTDIPLEQDHPSRRALETTAAYLPTLAKHPLLIVWGARDFCFNEKFLARWRELFPTAEVRRLADAGHYVLDDAPPDTLTSIARFLSP